ERRRQIAPRLDSLLNLSARRLKFIRSITRSATSLTKISNQILIIRAALSNNAIHIGHRDTQLTRSSLKTLLRILSQINFRTELTERLTPKTLLPETKIRSLNSFNQTTKDRCGHLSHLSHLRKLSANQLRRSN